MTFNINKKHNSNSEDDHPAEQAQMTMNKWHRLSLQFKLTQEIHEQNGAQRQDKRMDPENLPHTTITSATGNRYELLKTSLGKGKFGKVRQARQIGENGESTLVAIKKLNEPGDNQNSQLFAAFLREENIHQECGKRVTKGLMLAGDMINIVNHRGIPTLYQVFPLATKDGLELMRLQTHQAEWNMSFPYLAASLVETCAAMNAYHIFHRDLKPENFLIDDQGHVKISDFGSMTIYDEKDRNSIQLLASDLTDTNYIPPEYRFLKQNLQYDQSIDSWRLGLTLLQLASAEANNFFTTHLRGKYAADDSEESYLKIKKYFVKKMAELPRVLTSIPAEISQVILGLLNPDYAHRLTPAAAWEQLKTMPVFDAQVVAKMLKIETNQSPISQNTSTLFNNPCKVDHCLANEIFAEEKASFSYA